MMSRLFINTNCAGTFEEQGEQYNKVKSMIEPEIEVEEIIQAAENNLK